MLKQAKISGILKDYRGEMRNRYEIGEGFEMILQSVGAVTKASGITTNTASIDDLVVARSMLSVYRVESRLKNGLVAILDDIGYAVYDRDRCIFSQDL